MLDNVKIPIPLCPYIYVKDCDVYKNYVYMIFKTGCRISSAVRILSKTLEFM